jgi:outer membrane beta-barrel protein
MESRFRILFLICTVFLPVASGVAAEKPEADDKSLNQIIQQDPLITPAVERREVDEAAIEVNDFELGLFLGILSIEDFGANPVIGARLDYHLTEDLFLQGTIGIAEAGNTSADNFLGGPTVLGDDKDYLYYNVVVGYNLFPGESFMGGEKAFNTAMYVVAGAGVTEFGGDDRFTITVGGGYSVTLKDYLTLHLDVRDHIFQIDITGEDKDAHNLELSFGMNFVF